MKKIFVAIVILFTCTLFTFKEEVSAAVPPLPNGEYKISNNNGKVLQETNKGLVWSTWAGNDNQKWRFRYSRDWQFPEGYVMTSVSKDTGGIYWNLNAGNTVTWGEYRDSATKYSRFWTIVKENGTNKYSINNSGYSRPNLVTTNSGKSVEVSPDRKETFTIDEEMNEPTNEYSLVITSDPQYPWTDKTDDGISEPEKVKESRSEELIRAQYESVNEYNANSGLRSLTMINGDITAFGHGYQWDKMNNLFTILDQNYYYGLGNHDIENNQNDCFQDGCFNNSLNNLRSHVKQNHNIMDFDYNTVSSHGYSIEVGTALTYVQLNNYPTMSYTSNFSKNGFSPNLSWIEREFSKARTKRHNIIVGIHKPNDWKTGPSSEFISLLKVYKVRAVFAGHYHKNIGEFSSSNYFGETPVFLSGSASQQSYLIAENDMNYLNIYKVLKNDWRNKQFIRKIKLPSS